METKLERIADKSAKETRPVFTSLYHLLNEELLLACHKELDGKKAAGMDEVTKEEYNRNLKENIRKLVERLKNKSYKPQPVLRVYIPKANGKKRPLGIAAYEDKIVQLGLKKNSGSGIRAEIQRKHVWIPPQQELSHGDQRRVYQYHKEENQLRSGSRYQKFL